MIFDGLDEESDDGHIVMVEVKTGQARLSSRERRIRDAVLAGRVDWLEVRLTDRPGIDWSTITVSGTQPIVVWPDDE